MKTITGLEERLGRIEGQVKGMEGINSGLTAALMDQKYILKGIQELGANQQQSLTTLREMNHE